MVEVSDCLDFGTCRTAATGVSVRDGAERRCFFSSSSSFYAGLEFVPSGRGGGQGGGVRVIERRNTYLGGGRRDGC